jgi:hypothetical protein
MWQNLSLQVKTYQPNEPYDFEDGYSCIDEGNYKLKIEQT